ncbi:MAG: homocysteine S-methyltransferase family protein [Polyangiaceae bacterium]|nr:homocysteine S-methyltransferase family protein [Polyangiaceae bacterium]
MGTELDARGVPTPAPLWSAEALVHAPDVVASIHRDYAAAGATVHTANTFRTKRRQAGDRWEELCRLAVSIARGAVPPGHRVAGSVAPLNDCYRPDLSPKPSENARPEHRELCRALAAAGVDLILCETFPHVGEALVAVEEAVQTGLSTWVSFTAGPEADLLSPAEVLTGARESVSRGASAVLVNCVPAARTLEYVRLLGDIGVPFGAYANAGSPADKIGWGASGPDSIQLYLDFAQSWVDAGASIVGGCCGTGPAHIKALAMHFCEGNDRGRG